MIDGWIEQDMKRRMVNGELFNIHDIVEIHSQNFQLEHASHAALRTRSSRSHTLNKQKT